MIIQKANIKDLKEIMIMYKSCVSGMITNGIDQWDNSYPNAEIIKKDIKAETYYIAKQKDSIIGGINIDQNQDPTYSDIKWEEMSNKFLVVHRLGVKQEFWNKKVGKSLMLFVEDLVRKNNFKSIRLDTYSGNPKATKFYKNLDYKQLGHIYLKPNKNEYYCFEKIIR